MEAELPYFRVINMYRKQFILFQYYEKNNAKIFFLQIILSKGNSCININV
jgi:hypothetical protein